MQTCISPTTHPAPPRPPLEAAANEKLASGLPTSLNEANVWQTRTFTPELRWGNDYMHARYYNLNLGRFLSVDPVGGSVGSSQSWNRYTYVLNNPVVLVDPFGLKARSCGVRNGMPCWADDEEVVVTADDPDKEKARREREEAADFLLQFTLSSQGFHEREFNLFSDVAQNVTVPGQWGSWDSSADSSTWNDPGEDLEGGWNYAYKGLYVMAGTAAAGAVVVGGVEVAVGGRFLLWRYPNAGGFGANLVKNGQSILRLDWHRFGKAGKEMLRPHIDIPGKLKHWPW